MRETLQIDGGSTVRDPTLRGIDVGFEIQRRNSLHWGWHLRVDDLVPLQINADVPADLNGINFINFGVEWQLEHYFTRDAWAGVGPRAHYSRNKYDQAGGMTTTRNFGLELAVGLGFLF
jgi:hypothetical protein